MLLLTVILMNKAKKTATTAGFIYLVVIVTGMFSLAYVPKKLIDWNDVAHTFNSIRANPFLFRLGVYSSIVCYVAFVFLPLFLYKLFRTVSISYAVAMVILALIGVILSFNNLQNSYTILSLVSEEPFIKNIAVKELQSLLFFSLHQYDSGILLASLFWGLWLFPFGMLVYRSAFAPSLLGILLMLGCAGYVINFSGNTLLENYSAVGIKKYMSMLPAVAELSTCAWLLFFGLKKSEQWKTKNSSTRMLQSI